MLGYNDRTRAKMDEVRDGIQAAKDGTLPRLEDVNNQIFYFDFKYADPDDRVPCLPCELPRALRPKLDVDRIKSEHDAEQGGGQTI